MQAQRADLDTLVRSGANLLRLVREQTDSIGVAVSFGKDSLATLELACAIFPRVEGYYLYRVANMRIVSEWCDAAKKRWGVNVRQYPHFDLSRLYRNSIYQPHWKAARSTPRIKMTDIENAFRHDADVDWLAMGWRRNDSLSRALILKANGGIDFNARRVYPIRTWRGADVYSFLDSRRIPRPETFGRKDQGGLDFHPQALKFLRDNYPDDWSKWCQAFPFCEQQLIEVSDDDASPDGVALKSKKHERKART